jgi:hypothetical protein
VEDPEEKRQALLQLAAKYAPGREAASYAEEALDRTGVVKIRPASISGKRNPPDWGRLPEVAGGDGGTIYHTHITPVWGAPIMLY